MTNSKSLSHITNSLFDLVEKNKTDEKWSGILVGNKCDLEQDRTVDSKVTKDFAKKHNLLFIETSAKRRINIDEVFRSVIKHHLYSDPAKKPRIKSNGGLFSSLSAPLDVDDLDKFQK